MKIVDKPWGREIWFAENKHYLGKILEVNEGHRLSLQYHQKKHETMYVLEGLIKMTHNGKGMEMGPGDCLEILPGEPHRVHALKNSKIVEASTPHVDDVIRLEDDYERHLK